MRIIARLDIKGQNLIKGISLKTLEFLGVLKKKQNSTIKKELMNYFI